MLNTQNTPPNTALYRGGLSRRLLTDAAALLAAAFLSLFFAPAAAGWLAAPIGGITVLVAIETTETWLSLLRIALFCGFTLSLPVLLFQLAGALLPGLTRRELKWLLPVILLATLFYICGVVFDFFVILPAVPQRMQLLDIQTVLRYDAYFEFMVGQLFWMGLLFELPLLALTLLGFLIGHEKLAAFRKSGG